MNVEDLPTDKFESVRKLPVVVEARRLTTRTEIETEEGVVTGEPGDVLIRGVDGELYPCRADIFEQSYEETARSYEQLEGDQ